MNEMKPSSECTISHLEYYYTSICNKALIFNSVCQSWSVKGVVGHVFTDFLELLGLLDLGRLDLGRADLEDLGRMAFSMAFSAVSAV